MSAPSLSGTVGVLKAIAVQASSRDSLLNHMWTFVSSMDQLMKAAKDAADDSGVPAQSSPGKADAKTDPELPGSWDDPSNQERLLSATAQVRTAAAPMMVRLPLPIEALLPTAQHLYMLHCHCRTASASSLLCHPPLLTCLINRVALACGSVEQTGLQVNWTTPLA